MWHGMPMLVLQWPHAVLNATAVIFVIEYTGRPDRFQRLRTYGISRGVLHDRTLQVSLCLACLELASLIFSFITLHLFWKYWTRWSDRALLDIADMPYIGVLLFPILSTIYAFACHCQHLWTVYVSHQRMRPAFECHHQLASASPAEEECLIQQTNNRRQGLMPVLRYTGWTDMLSSWQFHYQFAQMLLLPTTVLVIGLKGEFLATCIFQVRNMQWFGLLDSLEHTASLFLLINTLLSVVALLLLVKGTTSHFRELGLFPPAAFQALWCAVAIALNDIAQLSAYGYLSRTNIDMLLHHVICHDGSTRGRPEIMIAAHAALFASLVYSLLCQVYLLVCGLRAGRAIRLAQTEQLIEL
ncbi:hypothetical protein AMS68_006108 [Peltaster fructicola]|uniref:Uncharacterized protein n=1 Tax=Peltaster fructicola TaxID=286661 RepID=A0A6H0Y0Z2_9PEZI|nr:hypothetical protein AMS68_006108 [Peltaster fructicola]